MLDAVDLCAGPGGWDVAARELGLNVLGIENDLVTCRTRRIVGLPTVAGDIMRYGPADFPAAGLIGSPPCTTFTMTGNGHGRRALGILMKRIKEMGSRTDGTLPDSVDINTRLILEPLRWTLEALDNGNPYRWVVLEQVPTVFPIWQEMAEVLRAHEYEVVVSRLRSEQYGVPQTRIRAVLLARLDSSVQLPVPTHSKYHQVRPDHLDPDVLPWISMSDVLGFEPSERIQRSNYSGPESPTARTAVERGRTMRSGDRPSVTITSKAFRWMVSGRLVTSTVSEAAQLQGFPVDYPWQGRKSEQRQQIGNAVPPRMAEAVLGSITTSKK
jgi:DNA (cytosine-5)-methyltransferase 1